MFGTNVENNFVNFRRALEDIRRQYGMVLRMLLWTYDF